MKRVAVAFMALIASAQAPPSCEPAACVKTISEKAPVRLVLADKAGLVGRWSASRGFSRSDVYLLSDYTYFDTYMDDASPRTIRSKRRWSATGSFVAFSADAEITWKHPGDQRFALLQEETSPRVLLFGLDRSLAVYHRRVAAVPSDAKGFLRFMALEKAETWPVPHEPSVKAALLRCCWKPSAYAK